MVGGRNLADRREVIPACEKYPRRCFVRDVGWYDLTPRLPPDRIYMFAASDDRFFDPAIVEEMWRRWGRPAIRWYPGSHMGFLVHMPEVIAEAVLHRPGVSWVLPLIERYSGIFAPVPIPQGTALQKRQSSGEAQATPGPSSFPFRATALPGRPSEWSLDVWYIRCRGFTVWLNG